MIKILRTRLMDIRDQLQYILPVHHDEVESDNWAPDPDWEQYYHLDDEGLLIVHAVFDDEVLIGYSVDWLSEHRHYRGKMVGINDLIYIKPEYRGHGLFESLLQHVQDAIKQSGGVAHILGLKIKSHNEKYQVCRGYRAVETVHHIYLGD